MNGAQLSALAVRLHERRSAPPTVSYYLTRNWQRHLLFLALYAALATACFALGHVWAGLVIVGFALGRQTRDLQWYRSLARDWPLTTEFIDWPRVETVRAAAISQESST